MEIHKFSATWCGPCKVLANIIKDIELPIINHDVDEEEDLAIKYNVISVPTILFIDNGKEVKRLLGVVSKQTIIDTYNELNKS